MVEQGGSPENQSLEIALAEARALVDQQDYDGALAMCHRLIEEYPESGDARSIMGDAYAGDAQWNEAVSWYERALDLNFDPSVMERLATARGNAIRAGTASSAAPQIALPRPRAPEPERSTAPQFVVGAVVAGVLLIPILAFILIRAVNAPDADESPPATQRGEEFAEDIYPEPQAGGATPQAPASPQAPATGSSAGGYAGTGGSALTPSTTPQPTAPLTGAADRPRTTTPQGGRSTRGTAQRGVAVSTRDQHIMGRLQLHRVGAGRSGVRATALALDDFSGAGILTISAPATTNLSRLENDLLLAAFYAGASAMRTDTGVNALIVRCITAIPNARGQMEDLVIFRTDISRAKLAPWLKSGRMPTMQQIQGEILQNIWWDKQALARYLQQQNRTRTRTQE